MTRPIANDREYAITNAQAGVCPQCQRHFVGLRRCISCGVRVCPDCRGGEETRYAVCNECAKLEA